MIDNNNNGLKKRMHMDFAFQIDVDFVCINIWRAECFLCLVFIECCVTCAST